MVTHHGLFSCVVVARSASRPIRSRDLMMSDGPLTRTFIVRLRREADLAEEPSEWRGEVERVPDGARTHFLGLEGVIEAMTRLLSEPER